MTPITAPFRGASSSDDMNTIMRATHTDLINMYTALATQQKIATIDNEVLVNTNASLAVQLARLAQQVASLQQSFQSIKVLGSNTVTAGSIGSAFVGVSLYDTPVNYGGVPSYPLISPSSMATYAAQYGQILPGLLNAPVSKTYVVDALSNTIVLPPNVATTQDSVVTPSVSPFLVEENNPGLAVDGSLATTWRRNVYFPATEYISDVSATIQVSVPSAYLNSLTCNYISIHPYPEFGVDITSVIATTPSGTEIELLTPLNDNGSGTPIKNAGKTRLIFNEMDIVSVSVTLRASSTLYTLKPGLQAFILGASLVDVGLISFSQSPSKILVPFTLANNFFSNITGISPLPDGVSAQLYYQNASGDFVLMNLGESPLGYSKTILLELTLTPSQGQAIAIEDLYLQFVPMYLAS
jgi:hypothetical protein